MSDRPIHLLYVCSGNICRSPMATGMTKSYARLRNRQVEVRSAGTLQLFNQPASPHAVTVCKEIGVDISSHRSQGVTQELVSWADHILVMEFAHAHYIREHFEHLDKVILFGHMGGVMEVPDPIGSWKSTYRKNRKLLQRCVESFVDRMPSRMS